jgi:hypothetical protein
VRVFRSIAVINLIVAMAVAAAATSTGPADADTIQVAGTEQTTSSTVRAPSTSTTTTTSISITTTNDADVSSTATTRTPPTPAPTTPAPTTTSPATTIPVPTVEERGAAALARIGYDWQGRLPGWTVVFEPGRADVLGFTHVAERRIEVFVRDDQDDALLAHVVAHELGHAVDVTLNSPEERQEWQAARGIESVPWWPGDGLTDFSTGAGDFAESFAAWQVGTGSFRSRVGDAPNGDQLALMARLSGG